MIKEIAKANENPKAVAREWQRVNHTRQCPDLQTITTLWGKLNRTDIVEDDTAAMATNFSKTSLDDTRELVDEFFTREPNESVREAAMRLGLARSTLFDVMKILKLTNYKIQRNQHLTEDHMEKRFSFAVEMLEKFHQNQIPEDKIWFSDEAYFSWDGHLDKQNYRFWER